MEQVLFKVVAREHQEMDQIRQHSPLVETYIQKVKVVESDGSWVPDGDHYFFGRAEFSKGFDLRPIVAHGDSDTAPVVANIARLFDFGAEFLPKGFLQMIYPDSRGLNTSDYHFDYVRREFLGEVRTLVFDVTPGRKAGKDRFIGRIWVEDQDFAIVRFNGSFSGHEKSSAKFHFDSWRVNAGPNLWLPAFIYSEEKTTPYPLAHGKTYKAQTRLWGYAPERSRAEEELSQVLVQSATPVVDQSQRNNDLSPIEEQRAWDQQAANNVIEKLETLGLVAPKGEVDKVLNTVVNNLEVTNNLNFSPDIQCRVLMTSTMESFSLGETIVLSRGLIDVLPDEASLAAMLAKEMGYILTTRRHVDAKYAFYDRLRFNENGAFQHFDFVRKLDEDSAAAAKAAELLKNSPYKDQLATAGMFVAELQARSREIPNLISPRVGDAQLLKLPVAGGLAEGAEAAKHIVALPLGGRIKLDPWNDSLELLKSQPVGSLSDREKMPFEVTPFMIYLTRGSENPKPSESLVPAPPAD